MYADFRQIINLWPTRRSLARDVNDHYEERGVSAKELTGTQVADWWRRDTFPEREFDTLIQLMSKRGFEVPTYADLSRLYRERRQRAEARKEN